VAYNGERYQASHHAPLPPDAQPLLEKKIKMKVPEKCRGLSEYPKNPCE